MDVAVDALFADKLVGGGLASKGGGWVAVLCIHGGGVVIVGARKICFVDDEGRFWLSFVAA